MNGYLQILLGSFGLSLVISYAWWVKLRVWIFRQDLFMIRDELWDRMRELDQLNNPAYRDLREAIHSLIRLAPFLSIPTIVRMLRREEFQSLLRRDPTIPEIDGAQSKVIYRVLHYLLRDSLLGRFLNIGAGVLGLTTDLKELLRRRITWLLESKEFEILDAHISAGDQSELARA